MKAPLVCLMKQNTMYTTKKQVISGAPVGIVVHSTGCNNTWLSRYVQPSPDDPNYDELISIIGKNYNNNSWNANVGKGVHYMIGRLKDGTPAIVQTIEETLCAGGVGSGAKGSYNYNPTAHIQFEIQEDSLTNKEYFDAVFTLAIELCADICERQNLPVSSICSHKECGERGYGSAHGDPENWLVKYGKTMDWFRSEVQKVIDSHKPAPQSDEWQTVFENEHLRIQTK